MVTEQTRATERSAGGRRADGISYGMEQESWRKTKKQSGKVEKSTTTISMLNALVVAFRLRVMMPLKQEDPVQNISKQNGSSARSAELK